MTQTTDFAAARGDGGSANALDAVAERTRDKRHHDQRRAACDDASETASGAMADARAALKGTA